MKYIELLDKENKGVIMWLNGKEQFVYEKGTGWKRSALFLDYSWPESDLYDLYKEISEKQAMKKIEMLEQKAD